MKGLKVSAKQIRRWRPAFRQQICWNRSLLNDHGVIDAGDHFHGTIACTASLDVNIEHVLQSLRPAHRCPALVEDLLVALVSSFGLVVPAPPGRRH